MLSLENEPGRVWRDLGLLALATVLVYLAVANHSPLGSTVRYYEASREMLESGDWVVPQLNYVPYVEKPPLIYWLGAAARALGTHPLLTNLPSLLAALITVLTTYLFAQRWQGRRTGLIAAALLLGSTYFQVMSGILITDILLTAALTVAGLLWWRWDQDRTRTRYLYAFYFTIGMGWLCKGPIALALPAVGIVLFAGYDRGFAEIWRTMLRMRPWWGAMIIVAVNLPWSLLLAWHDPRLLSFFYLRINFAAFMDGSYNHQEPWHYYVPIVLAALMPLTAVSLPLLIRRLIQSLRRRPPAQTQAEPLAEASDRTDRYLSCLLVAGLLFLSCSKAKLGTYILPLVPVMMLLVARVLTGASRLPRWVGFLNGIQATLVLIATLVITIALPLWAPLLAAGDPVQVLGHVLPFSTSVRDIEWSLAPLMMVATATLAVSMAIALVCMATSRFHTSLLVQMLGFFLFAAQVLPQLDAWAPQRDGSLLVQDLLLRQADAQRVSEVENRPASLEKDAIVVETAVVHDYEILLGLKQPVYVWGSARETGLGFFVEATPKNVGLPGPGQPVPHPYHVSGESVPHPRLWSTQKFDEQWSSPRRVWLFTRESQIAKVNREGLVVYQIGRAGKMVLVSNQP